MFSLLENGPLWQKPSDSAASGHVFTSFLSFSHSLLFLCPLVSLYRYLSAQQQPRLVFQAAWRQRNTHVRFPPSRVEPETGVIFDIEYDWTESWGMRYGDGPHPVPPTAVFIYATWYRNLHTCTHMQRCLPLYFTPDSMYQMKNDVSQVFVVLEENIFLCLCEDCTSISFC